MTITTPTAGRALRRAAIWIAAAAVLVIAAILAISSATGGLDQGVPLAADNPAPPGAMAVAEVLKDQGVQVVQTGDLDATTAAASHGDATILLWDLDLLLDEGQHARLLRASTDLVVVEPTGFELQDLAPGVSQAGGSGGVFDADCDLTAVQKAGSVEADGSSYRIAEGEDAGDAVGCLADGDRFGLVQLDVRGTTVTLLGLSGALRNDTVDSAGNAALALNLLGRHGTLVWYIPTAADLEGQVPPTIAELTPPWITPLAVLLVLVALGAVFWRARRVGPLVLENMPVVVRSSETMRGRARLYERAGARLHALDALRIGTVTRLATASGLSRLASVDEVADAVAALTGRDRSEVADILIHRIPQNDAELVRLSDDLLQLETDTEAAARP
jgi:hypothetical protein